MAETANESETQETPDQPKLSEQTRQRTKSSAAVKFWICVAVFLSLASAGGAGYVLYRMEFQVIPQFSSDTQQIQSVQNQISDLAANTSESNSQLETQLEIQLQSLSDEVEETEEAISRLEGVIQQTQSQVTQQVDGVKESISAIYEEQDNDADSWKLEEIIFLMVMAKHRVEISGDVQSALVVWRVADDQLLREADPRLLDAKLAIENEIAALEALPTLDLGNTAQQLVKLANDLEQLPLNLSPTRMFAEAEQREESSSQKEESEADTETGFVSEVWGDIKSLVRVRKIDANEQSLLKPAMKIYLVENLKSALFNAQVAVLRSDQQVYQENIQYVQNAVSQHFSTDSPDVVAFSNQLNSLIGVELELDVPDLSGSITLLREVLNSSVTE